MLGCHLKLHSYVFFMLLFSIIIYTIINIVENSCFTKITSKHTTSRILNKILYFFFLHQYVKFYICLKSYQACIDIIIYNYIMLVYIQKLPVWVVLWPIKFCIRFERNSQTTEVVSSVFLFEWFYYKWVVIDLYQNILKYF